MLYVDDLIIYISNPDISISRVIVINSFGGISRYKIHFYKSKLFPINNEARQLDLNNFHLKYLIALLSTWEFQRQNIYRAIQMQFHCSD